MLQDLDIRSPRFNLEVQKSLALNYLESSSQSVKNQVVREIEDSLLEQAASRVEE